MARELTRATLKIILPGLVAGGLCGAAVGLGVVPPIFGTAAAIGVGLAVGFMVVRKRRKYKDVQSTDGTPR